MKDESSTLPNEDAAIETVLEGNDDDVLELLRQQPSLTGFVKDIQSVKEGLKSIEEEEAPSLVIEKIIQKKRRNFFSWLQDLPLEWYKNPFILTFGFVMATIFFYFLIIYLLK